MIFFFFFCTINDIFLQCAQHFKLPPTNKMAGNKRNQLKKFYSSIMSTLPSSLPPEDAFLYFFRSQDGRAIWKAIEKKKAEDTNSKLLSLAGDIINAANNTPSWQKRQFISLLTPHFSLSYLKKNGLKVGKKCWISANEHNKTHFPGASIRLLKGRPPIKKGVKQKVIFFFKPSLNYLIFRYANF